MATASLEFRRHRLAPYASAAAGLALVVFEVVEVVIIPFNVLQPLYAAGGLAIFALAFLELQQANQETDTAVMLQELLAGIEALGASQTTGP